MNGLLASAVHRPYVFVFLAAFLFLSWLRWGWRRTLLWLVSGYGIAWASEYSSITNGFPYGWYAYVYENLRGELLIAGVPFFDSLSYAFLTFAGYTMGESILGRTRAGTIAAVAAGALLTMFLDVIVDPIATMGDKWFLGLIHTYRSPGWYFGVPMTNFGGWFLTAFAIIGFNAIAWRLSPSALKDARPKTSAPWLFPVFYAGIALFSIAISFWVGAWPLGLVSCGWLAAILAFMFMRALR